MTRHTTALGAMLLAATLLAGCGHKARNAAAKQKQAPATATASEASASAPATTAERQKVDHDGNTGEVRGTAAPDSKFNLLRMGMSMKEVTKLIGKPTDKHSYVTGKGVYSVTGDDTYRQEFIYKGLGRLTFAANGGFSLESHLIRIIHDPQEKGTRS